MSKSDEAREQLTRRQAMLMVAGGAAIPAGVLGLPGLAAGATSNCPPFTPIVSNPLRLSGRVIRTHADWGGCLPPFILMSDRIAGYVPMYLDGDLNELGTLVDTNPHASFQGVVSNHEAGVLVFHADPGAQLLSGPEPLPNFDAPFNSDPPMSMERQTLEELFMLYCRAGFDNPDFHTNEAMYDMLGKGFELAFADPDFEQRQTSLPFTPYHIVADGSLEGESLHEVWLRSVYPFPSSYDDPFDGANECAFEIGLAVFMFLLGQILARTSPATARAARDEMRGVWQNAGVQASGTALFAAIGKYAGSGAHADLTDVLRKVSDFVRAMVPLLPGAFYRVIRRSCTWWEYVAAMGLSAAFIARAVKLVLTAVSLAMTLVKIYKACFTNAGCVAETSSPAQ